MGGGVRGDRRRSDGRIMDVRKAQKTKERKAQYRGNREEASFAERLQIALFFCNLAVRKKTYRKRELCYQKHYKMP